jgi:hypothetical protein
MDSEKLIERKLREGVRKMGGLALKWVSPGITGVPDRIVMMPGGKVYFVELKSTGVKPTARQLTVHRKLNGLGMDLWVIDSLYQLSQFLNLIKPQL